VSVEQLQHILGVARDELRNGQDVQMAEANKSRRPIDPAITAGAMVLLDSQDLPITYANVNPTRDKLVHQFIGPCETLQLCGNALELDLPTDRMMYDTVNVSKLKVDHIEDSGVTWRPPPPLVRTSCVGPTYVVQSNANHRPSSEGTGWKYNLKWEGCDE